VNKPCKDRNSSAYLELFFPIHYKVGIAIEDTLRSEALSRQQTCILWMIRSKGIDGESMRRKDIEKALQSWFEVSSSAVSKALRALCKPPLELITMVEDPASGREKLVSLTPEGKRFLSGAIANGVELMDWMTSQLTDDEIKQGIRFLTRVSEIFETLPQGARDRSPNRKSIED